MEGLDLRGSGRKSAVSAKPRRTEMEKDMEIKMLADRAAVQIAAYPVITGKEKLKRFVRSGVLRQKLAPIDPFSWPNAMLGQGLLAAYEATGDKKYLQAVAEHLKQWKTAGYPIHCVDNIMNGSLALWTEELILKESAEKERKAPGAGAAPGGIGGENAGKEYDCEAVLALCREAESACASWLHQAARTGQGILPYRAQHPDWLFADTLGLVCPFLCRYAAAKKDEEFMKLGIAQLTRFLEKGMDFKSGLPYHGYDEKSGMKYGIIGWGRACGWVLKGLAESLPYIPGEREEYEILKSSFERLTEAVCGYQRPDGGFSWQLEALEGHRDTSAEGMIGTAIMRGLCAGTLEVPGGQEEKGIMGRTKAPAAEGVADPEALAACGERLRRLSRVLEQSVSDGIVKDCSGECRGFAEYPQNYGSYPWGSGSALEFFAMMEN